MDRAFGAPEWGLLGATALLWGSPYLLIAISVETLPPLGVALLRVVLGAALVACAPAARRGRIARADWPRVGALGVLWLALPLVLFPLAERSVSSAVAGMITGAQPLFAAVIAATLLRRVPRRRTLAGLALGFGGVVAIALASVSGGTGSTAGGVGLVLAAVVSYAISTNLAVPLQQRYGSLPVILRALAVAGAVLAVPGVVRLVGATPSAASLGAVIPLGLLCTGAGYLVFTTLIGRAGATRGAVAIYFVPLVALVLGVAVRGDRVGAVAVAGVALVVAGAWLTSAAPAAHRPVSPAATAEAESPP